MIRILQVLGGLNLGGAETMVMNLYRAMDRTKIQFDFVIHLSEKQAYEDEVLSMGGRIYRIPQYNGKNTFEMIKAWNHFFELHIEYKIMHSHVRSYASLFVPIAKKHGVKTIIHSHSTSNGSGILSYVKSLMQYPLRYQADYCFGCSKEAGQWLFGEKVCNSSKYHMIKNAIDTSLYNMNYEVRKRYRDSWNVVDSSKVLIHVGRLHEAKNHLFLLEVFARYHEVNKDSLLVIVGDGELADKIRDKIDELNIKDNVKMLGARNDVPQLLLAADCFVFPSKWEGLPVTVVEAQASGLPCLVSDTVTKDVNVTELVNYLPIDEGVEPWLNMLKSISFERKNVIEEIVKAGFDTISSAKNLFDFYKRILEDE